VWDQEQCSLGALQSLRSRCEADGGFLSLLQAPNPWKQAMEPWGYSGNALPIMGKLKQQFDPDRHLSPGRFVGGL